MTAARLPTGTPGPQRPWAPTPPLAPRSARRTYATDLTRPDGFTGPVVAEVRGDDVRTDGDGTTDVTARVAVSVEIDQVTGAVVRVTEQDAPRALGELVGVDVRSGYGRRVSSLLADEAVPRSLLYSALEDLGGAYLVSGYALLHAGLLHGDPDLSRRAALRQADICSGWAADGPLLASLRDDGINLTPYGPPAPSLGDQLDPPPLHAVRRRRRLDVGPADDGTLVVQSHFRDSHVGSDGETVMHEYLVDARVEGGRLAEVEVDARVLPWEACPGAVASAQRLVGVAIDEIPSRVRADLVGVGTCTHLNSTLRCLADLSALAALVG